MGKAKITPTNIDLLKKLKNDAKKQAGRVRADFSGVTENSIGASGSSSGVATTIGNAYTTSGGRISGAISFFPKTITLPITGILDLTDQTEAGNVTVNTSNVNVIGYTLDDDLVTINGAANEGHVLFLKAAGTNINIKHNTGNIMCPGAVDYPVLQDESAILIWNVLINKWQVTGTEAGAGGGSGIDNVVEDLTPELGGDLDALGLDINNVGTLDFNTHADAWIAGIGTDIIYNVNSTDTHNFTVGGSSQFGIDSTYVTVLNNILKLRETSTSNTTLEMHADSPSPNDFDTISSIIFYGENNASSKEVYGRIDAIQNDVTSGTEDGEVIIGVTGAGFQNAAQLILEHTTLELRRSLSNSLGDGCEMVFHNDDSSMNDGQTVGRIRMDSNDSGGNQTVYGQMTFTADDVTNGTEDGGFDLEVMQAGTLRNWLYIDGGGMNLSVPSGDSVDFWVAGTRVVQILDQGLNMFGNELDFNSGGRVDFADNTTTIGSNGSASPLTANPVGYALIKINGVERQIPYYRVA